ncbi:hypothetical protein PYR78_00975 (plasmid) [Acinetobacter johnsonii]|nr:hypothetical protein [Acinetobacter soli]WEI02430.1 hypothetical protein PYR78_00975 [Acinetobacter johnsonii]WEH93576.1 hypothetical protein PYR75_17045 [Acinetobacter soli]WEH96576.1 hypothetical protein PYR76_01600 [Acinetobacter soli]WEI02101.1 hypothetical protein PYR77_15935 [Acinetobacter soli]WEI11094.1 hypothetical protein PYR73_17490 [Acinetobacter soli]
MSEEVKYEDRVRAAYRSAQGNVAQEFSLTLLKHVKHHQTHVWSA